MRKSVVLGVALLIVYAGVSDAQLLRFTQHESLMTPLTVASQSAPTKSDTVDYLIRLLNDRRFDRDDGEYTVYSYRYNFTTDTLIQRKDDYNKDPGVQSYSERFIPVREIAITEIELGEKHVGIILHQDIVEFYYKPNGQSNGEFRNSYFELTPRDSVANADPTTKHKIAKAFMHLHNLVKAESDPFFVSQDVPIKDLTKESKPTSAYDPCKHVYVGKLFDGRNMYGFKQTYLVLGYSSRTAKATVANQYDRSVIQELDCYQIPE